MKLQFEVGDKAIWKGGKVTDAYRRELGSHFEKGTELTYVGEGEGAFDHEFSFAGGPCFSVFDDQIERPTTPTTIVTVHGNPEWKPEKGEQIGWKIIEWFPMSESTRESCETIFIGLGYHIAVGSEAEKELNPAKHPKHFAPVYKEAKPIEFVKYITATCEQSTDFDYTPNMFTHIHVFRGNMGDMDTFICYKEHVKAHLIYFGHLNSGTI